MVKLCTLFMISLLLVSFKTKQIESSENSDALIINLSNIRNEEGFIYVFLYSYENQYPYKPYKYYKYKKGNLKSGSLAIKIAEMEMGHEYAIALIDDENNNEDLDRWLGIPNEGYGFSNDVKPFLSLPKYADLTFNFEALKKVNIKLQYVL